MHALKAYIHEVEAVSPPKIEPADADALIESSRTILDLIEMGERPPKSDEDRDPTTAGH